MTSDDPPVRDDDPVEFTDVRQVDGGKWTARHIPSGETIEGEDRQDLEVKAAAKRVAHSLRQADDS